MLATYSKKKNFGIASKIRIGSSSQEYCKWNLASHVGRIMQACLGYDDVNQSGERMASIQTELIYLSAEPEARLYEPIKSADCLSQSGLGIA